MPKTKIKYCEQCERNTECLYKGRKGERDFIPTMGMVTNLVQLLDDDRPKFWQCTKCGEIFEE